MKRISLLVLAIGMIVSNAVAQDPALTDQQEAQVEAAFERGNQLMEQKKFGEALTAYKAALAITPSNPAILYNGGLAAYSSKDHATAAELWKRLKALETDDWQVRAKLIQTYQALNVLAERDAERRELFDMWQSGKSDELRKQFEYCRDQFEVKDKRVMAFEHFELKGNRALRYVFSILNEDQTGEAFRISLGSYDLTNSVWRETRKPPPKPDERLFHLDGYFKGRHATYGFYAPEPSYDQVRARVIQILEGNISPVSSSTVASPNTKPETKPEPKPKP